MDSSIVKIVINVNGTDIEFSSLNQIRELRDVLNEMLVSKADWIYYPYPAIPPTIYTVTCDTSNISPDCVVPTSTAGKTEIART